MDCPRLSALTRMYNWNLASEEDVLNYIEYLREGGTRLKTLLASKEDVVELEADFLRLIEFEKISNIARGGKESGTSLLYELLKEALLRESAVVNMLLSRLILRGSAKEVANCILSYFSATVDTHRPMKNEVPFRGGFSESASTTVICAYMMRAMEEKITLKEKDRRYYMCFSSTKDYNVAYCVAYLFLRSLVFKRCSESIVDVFHPRSQTRVPLKMQLMLIDVLYERGKAVMGRQNKYSDVATTVDHPAGPAMYDGGDFQHGNFRNSKLLKEEVATPLEPDTDIEEVFDILKFLLAKMSLLWAQLDEGDHYSRSDYIAFATCIIRALKLSALKEHWSIIEREKVSMLVSGGVSDRLSGLNAEMNITGAYVAAALAKWEVAVGDLVLDDADGILEPGAIDIASHESLTYLMVAETPFIIDNSETITKAQESGPKSEKRESAEREDAKAPSATIEDENKLRYEKWKEMENEGFFRYRGRNDVIIDEIFHDVQAPAFVKPVVNPKKTMLDPPRYIQQCYERLSGKNTVGDVEPARMLNKGVNRPSDMPNALQIVISTQALMYLPSIIEKQERTLPRYAVPIAEILLKLKNLELYDDALKELRRNMRSEAPVTEGEPETSSPLDLFSDGHGHVELVTAQHLVYASLLCLTVKCPLEMFKYLCDGVTDNEYSVSQQATMLLCMQCATKRLSKQISYSELTRHMITNVKCLQPITGPKDYLVNVQRTTRPEAARKKIILMPWQLTEEKELPLLQLPRVALGPPGEHSQEQLYGPQGDIVPFTGGRLVQELDNNTVSAAKSSVVQRSAVGPSTSNCKQGLIREVQPGQDGPASSLSKAIVVNKFADLANMVVAYVLDAAERRLKVDLKRKTSTPSDVITVGVLETLEVCLTNAGGHLDRQLFEKCKQTAVEAYKAAYKVELRDILGRLIHLLQNMLL